MKRKFLLTVLCVAASVVAGVSTASALIGDGEAEAPPVAQSKPGDRVPAAGTESFEGEARPNGGPPWSVGVWKSETGKTCAVAGQKVGGRIGRVDARDGRFREYPKAEGPPCFDHSALPAGWAVDGRVTSLAEVQGGDVTLVWGLVEEGVVEVRVRRGGAVRRLTPTSRGAFVTAYPGFGASDGITIEAVRSDGSVKAQPFGGAGRPSPEELRAHSHPDGAH